jgi:hypothetical protein
MLELARLEWTERLVAMAPDDPEGALPPLSMDRPAVFTRAVAWLSLDHAVHRLDDGVAPVVRPTWLCVHRDPGNFEVRVLSLSKVAHALMVEMASGARSLRECVHAAARGSGASVDGVFVRAPGELLADLSERGVLRGAAGTEQ